MNAKNEETTRLMREVAERKYAEIGERHVYTGLVNGLAEVLRREGVTDLPPDPKCPWIRDMSWELANLFHWPLAEFDPHRTTVGEIANAVGQTLTKDGHEWSRMTGHQLNTYFMSSSFANFDDLEWRASLDIRALKLRKGSKRFDEYFATNCDRAVAAVRAEVAKGIERYRNRAATRASEFRHEHLRSLDEDCARRDRKEELWRAMIAAGGVEVDTIRNIFEQFDDLRTKREAERRRIREVAASIEKEAAELDATAETREGMTTGNRPFLAKFWSEYERRTNSS
jgi:hypothetical protein